MWPPVSVGGPLALGLVVSWLAGDPLRTSGVTVVSGWLLVAAFVVWNGWALATIARRRTALLPGAASMTVIDSGPFARSRNPLYLGLLVGSAGAALLAASLWALVALPLEWALLTCGAVMPAERSLCEVRTDVPGVRRPGPQVAVAPPRCPPRHAPLQIPELKARAREAWPARGRAALELTR
jgi:protein-S-isoprenylcysteine O-methyltransferase Ste14